jgi:hypothetical protein|tara:strand:- start:83 stop:742 length:660 start_codon:yes stop_codon:yes gene_type:complete
MKLFFKKIFNKIKNLIYKFRRLIFKKKYLNLGSDTRSPYFLTIDLSTKADLTLDITKPVENNLHNKFDFIWSERLLEHIDYQKISIVFENIHKMLKKNGFCRFSLPVCYSKLNTDMMRSNNMQKSASMGHVTWFTYEGFGEVRDELFGLSYPPKDNLIAWEEILDQSKFKFRLVMYFDKLKNLNLDENIYDSKKNIFKDVKEINMKRSNSFIFDLVKLD